MCSTILLVVQSTMVSGRSVRGSAAKATTTSLDRARSCAAPGTARPSTATSTASVFTNRIGETSLDASACERLDVAKHARLVLVPDPAQGVPEADAERVLALDGRGDAPRAPLDQPPLGRLDQRLGQPPSPMLARHRQPVDVPAPAIPAADHRADDAAAVVGD